MTPSQTPSISNLTSSTFTFQLSPYTFPLSTFPFQPSTFPFQPSPFIIYLNIHTHTPAREGEATPPSAGLHPWHLTEDWENQLHALDSCTPAALIGECGLDRLCDTPYPLQLAAFEAQIQLSERLQRPLILHCVRAADDVLRLHHGTTQPWIWHGFRGKPQQLRQLIAHGFYISFGFRFNAESLRLCPPERLFLETDDDPRPVSTLYATAAALRSTTAEALNRQCWDNYESILHNSPQPLSQ